MPQIFEQTFVGTLKPRNRLVRSATWEGMAQSDGLVNDKLVEFYRQLAHGGVGTIISSYMYVDVVGRQWPTQIGAGRDESIPGLARLADVVHEAGGVLVGQIVHCGGQAKRAANGDKTPVAPSAVDSPGYLETPRELSLVEVEKTIEAFAMAAKRLKEAGFDGVQLHGAHGYLLSEFLSPGRNVRNDRYGGSLENRARFTQEVFAAVRAEVGETYPIGIKLNASDFLDGSTTEKDSCYLASKLAEAGISSIEVSGGTPGSGKLTPVRGEIESMDDEGYFLPQAKQIREAAPNVPIILVGGLRSPFKIESILASGEADYFSMSRPLIREPHLPNRWQSGDPSPAKCISCNGCFKPAMRGKGLRCIQEKE